MLYLDRCRSSPPSRQRRGRRRCWCRWVPHSYARGARGVWAYPAPHPREADADVAVGGEDTVMLPTCLCLCSHPEDPLPVSSVLPPPSPLFRARLSPVPTPPSPDLARQSPVPGPGEPEATLPERNTPCTRTRRGATTGARWSYRSPTPRPGRWYPPPPHALGSPPGSPPRRPPDLRVQDCRVRV